ncbi:MAG: hypothetical protein [Circular genetic element sp.]|nr:MAG: hypothetical protein [Circular genetic element sp.]
MAKAYKITSDPFFVNGSITETGANTYTANEISLPLDSLNQEGVLVHAVYFTSSEPEQVPNQRTGVTLEVSATSKTGLIGANDANLIARRQLFVSGGAAEFSGPHVVDFIGSTAPYQESDNLMIVATDNVFFAIKGINNTAAASGQFRMVCSRVKLDAAAYAALVTNELTS